MKISPVKKEELAYGTVMSLGHQEVDRQTEEMGSQSPKAVENRLKGLGYHLRWPGYG